MTVAQITTIIAAIIGGISALIPGVYGDVFFYAVLFGSISGGVIGYLFSQQQRSANHPSLAVQSFSPAGLAGAVAGCVIANSSWTIIILSCIFGWLLRLILPTALIALINIIDKIHTTSGEQRAPQLLTAKDEEIYGTRTIAFFEKVFDESMKIANSFLLDGKPSPHIDESDIKEFGDGAVSFLRRVIELEKSKVGRASPHHSLCKPISNKDSETFGSDYVDLAQRAAIDWLNGYRFNPSKKAISSQLS